MFNTEEERWVGRESGTVGEVGREGLLSQVRREESPFRLGRWNPHVGRNPGGVEQWE